MKKHIFALITMMSALCGASISASDCANCVYVDGFGGYEFMENIQSRDHVKFKAKNGYMAGAAIGFNCDDVVRVEAELAYRNHGVRDIKANGASLNDVKVDGKPVTNRMKNETFTVMANVYHDFDLDCLVTPYIGGGIGYAHNRFTPVSTRNVDVTAKKNELAYQGIAGVSYRLPELSSKASVGIEYRYFATKHHIKDHSVAVNLKRYF